MTVTVVLSSSTYEGIAMNAPQPPGDTNTTSDVIPIFEDGWTFYGHDYQGGFSRWHASRQIDAGEEVEFHVRVLDYAAEARIYVGSADSLAWSRMNFIPLYVLPWLSNADADSDGFTVWEEYRGFMTVVDDDPVHARLDTATKELFVHQDGSLDDSLIADLESEPFLDATLIEVGPGVGTYTDPLFETFNGFALLRYFLDFNSHVFHATQWIQNTMCTPSGLESFPWEWAQGHPIIEDADIALVMVHTDDEHEPPADTMQAGDTEGYIVPGPARDACGQVPHYPGGGGCGGVTIFSRGIVNYFELEILAHPAYFDLWPNFENDCRTLFVGQQFRRAVAHEFGHVIGIDHHCTDTPGTEDAGLWSIGCVMKYPNRFDFPRHASLWTNFLHGPYGTGYWNDGQDQFQWHCRDERAFRPVDASSWPGNQ
jgi:hypothetical protein